MPKDLDLFEQRLEIIILALMFFVLTGCTNAEMDADEIVKSEIKTGSMAVGSGGIELQGKFPFKTSYGKLVDQAGTSIPIITETTDSSFTKAIMRPRVNTALATGIYLIFLNEAKAQAQGSFTITTSGGLTTGSVSPIHMNPASSDSFLVTESGSVSWKDLTLLRDQSVMSFARSSLPTCTGGQVLSSGSGILMCQSVSDSSKLPLSGGTMTGALNLGGNSISNLASPTSSQDAATKSYVDSLVVLKAPLASASAGFSVSSSILAAPNAVNLSLSNANGIAAQASFSSVLSGVDSTTMGSSSVAIGNDVKTLTNSEIGHSSGKFSLAGDSGTSTYHLMASSSGNTAFQLFAGSTNPGYTIKIHDQASYSCDLLVTSIGDDSGTKYTRSLRESIDLYYQSGVYQIAYPGTVIQSPSNSYASGGYLNYSYDSTNKTISLFLGMNGPVGASWRHSVRMQCSFVSF